MLFNLAGLKYGIDNNKRALPNATGPRRRQAPGRVANVPKSEISLRSTGCTSYDPVAYVRVQWNIAQDCHACGYERLFFRLIKTLLLCGL